MKTIVVGYGESDASERALRRATELAEALSARLVVVSVGESAARLTPELVPPVTGPVAAVGSVPLPAPPGATTAGPEPEEIAEGHLEQARASLAGRKVEVEFVARIGDPAERLLAVADERDADLIVVGSSEHGLLERLIGRPVDEAVARRSERDVLLVH